jgi:hypothetical protein
MSKEMSSTAVTDSRRRVGSRKTRVRFWMETAGTVDIVRKEAG